MASILGYKRNGYFIDLAANDAVRLSNTRALERDYSWSRICIEPNPRYHDRHQAVRTRLLKFAVADTESNFQFRDSGEVGGLISKPTDYNKPDQQGSTFPVRTVPFKGSFSLFFFPLPPCGVCRSSVPSVINYRRPKQKYLAVTTTSLAELTI